MHLRPPKTLSVLVAIALLPTGCFDPHVPFGDTDDASDATTAVAPSDGENTADASTTGIEPDSGSGDPLSVCGDGVVESDEVCDDGVNDGGYGGCNADCTAPGPFCGDGILNGEESCDDGDDIDGNGCNVDCVVSGSVLWTVMYDGPDHGIDAGRSVAIDLEDNIIVSGTVMADGQTTAWLRKYNPEGGAIWTEFFPSSNNDSSAGPMVGLLNGDVVFGGGFDTMDAASSPDAWVQRISGEGTQTWTRTYASPQGWMDQVADLDVDTDGYIYALFTEANEGFVRKYDQEGAELWTIFLDDNIAPRALATDPTGQTVVVGNDLSGTDFAPYIAKFNNEGGSTWSETLVEYDNAYFTRVDVDSEGNIIAGLISVNSDERLVFFDPSGATLDEVFPHTEDASKWIESTLLLDDGQFVAAGIKGDDGHLWITRYASDGSDLWTYTYNGDDWGLGFDTVASVGVDSKGNVIAVGFVQETESVQQDVWVTKFAP